MSSKLILLIAVGIFGVVTGEDSLRVASTASPPITWEVLPYLFLGVMIAVFVVITIQIFRENKKCGQWALNCMSACSIYFTATGASAVVLAGQVNPGTLLFLVVGLGTGAGILGSWYLFRVRHLNNHRQ